MYTIAKNIHLGAIALSFTLFAIRFVLTLKQSQMLQKKWLKITPHIADTLLILSAIWLCIGVSLYPLSSDWATSKLIGLVLYVLSVGFALKWARNNVMRFVGFAGAVAWLLVTSSLAITKDTLF